MNTETTPGAGPVDQRVRQVRIKRGALVFQDHGSHRWPMTAGGPADESMTFSAKWTGRAWDCLAFGFGQIGGGPGSYGCGGIYVHDIDGVEVLDDMLSNTEGEQQ